MFTSFYTLIRIGNGFAAVTEPGHPGKVKTYTKPKFARSVRTQTGEPDAYRILETLIYSDGVIENRWVA